MVCTKKGRVNWGRIAVVPLAGTWIETPFIFSCVESLITSFPLRERGLKLITVVEEYTFAKVVPLAGTWIETLPNNTQPAPPNVVPLAGTWIETAI